ncbi:MAG: biotin carboxylase N-terminal domain-containing protein [Pseudomonadales bacterium]
MSRINKLLIANRGEIACRIIDSARRLGISTIAVYSTVDKTALHVAYADESICIGDPPPGDSYLNTGTILAAAKVSSADAIHPGYGFLAESADFARACIGDGLIFVGPSADAIHEMGHKGVARQRMEEAGVPVLPGINEVSHDPDEILAQAEQIGYPLLVKPEAGGGGKGMKIVREPKDLIAAIDSARREATSSFGTDRLIIEKYLVGPRHIEIQVFADHHGNCIHINERDCSLQRRHQKIVEESPAPGLSQQLREAMGAAAVTAARAIDYVGAGTVEFLLGEHGQFYFMEMNTRLQVEHPVTELVTGYDLVAWQLKVAVGEPLPASQHEVPLRGHAMEARLYAEDPLHQFLPVAGKIVSLSLPLDPDIRIDTGVRAGDYASVYYDPMLMKIIARGEDRDACMTKLRAALGATQLTGIRTNRDFLCHILDHPPFRRGALGTDYLDHHLDDVYGPPDAEVEGAFLCGAALFLSMPAQQHLDSPWHSAINFRLNAPHTSTLTLVLDGRSYDVNIQPVASQPEWTCRIMIAGRTRLCRLLRQDGHFDLDCDGTLHSFTASRHHHRVTLISSNRVLEFSLPFEETLVTEAAGNVQAPMSGKVIAILVSSGEPVEKGTPLAVIEAMKMEHTVHAPVDGIVGEVHFGVGDLVDEGRELLDFKADTAAPIQATSEP